MLGLVSKCGVPLMMEMAKWQQGLVRMHGLPPEAATYRHFLQEHEIIELAVRMGLRKELEEVALELPGNWMSLAQDIWFDLTYPTPPMATPQSNPGNR